ncbi:nucleoside-diphosphate sugar epimerase [Zafaria cholistanensis]|uniref:Nucleoside-diphosphate sugar epimerase n=1 Tax=Zafaria cholistanensis TaxID=1682741 RepID=A0A5A7NS60_9MICC|nr:NAD-dependent epimerase/dehydratase family protein [Zafaria cholistanensis]GER22797.1 nucleoside-diphosphate sugar epimerase [Zafaria cholistanensis]
MRIAVVGATGNMGTALLHRIRTAQRAGHPGDLEVVGVARRLPDATAAPYDAASWRAVDVSAADAVDRLAEVFAGCDAVVHLAWVVQPSHDETAMRRINVDGTAAMLEAAARAGVGHVVCASSVGAYRPGPKDRRVDESWPVDGIPASSYSRFKGEQEALLDRFAVRHPSVKVARLRPGLIFQARAGSEVRRFFVGPWLPVRGVHRLRLPLLPYPEAFIFQAVHAEDAAEAYWRVVERGATGAFNIAGEPVLGPGAVASLFGARRWLPLPTGLVRGAVAAAWHLRVLAADPGWVDMAAGAPLVDTTRARQELGWSPRKSSLEALREVVAGLGEGHGVEASPLLRPEGDPA